MGSGHPGGSGTIVSALIDHASKRPDKVFCHLRAKGEHHRITYGALLQESARFAGLYRRRGVGRGDVVMIVLPTHPAMFPAFFGAMLAGAVPTFMPAPSPKQEPGHYWRSHLPLFERIRPARVLTDGATAAQIAASGLDPAATPPIARADQAGAPLPASDFESPASGTTAFLQHSSGTTSLKKGVMLSYGALERQVRAYAQAIAATADDVVVSWLPVYHDMGLVACTLVPATLGQTIVVLDPFEWSAQPASLFEAIAEHRGTLVWLPNFAFEHLVRTADPRAPAHDLSSVRAFIDCSEPCKPATFERFAARFADRGVTRERLQVCYAMAETVFAVTQTRLGREPRTVTVSAEALRTENRARAPRDGETALALLSTGTPIDGMRVRIAAADGRSAPEGAVGEVVISGDCLFDGYHRLPDTTRERLVEGEYRSRDLGFLRGGELYLLGRMDDLIIVHGKNFYAHEIELALGRVPGIKPGRAVAFGVDNAAVGSSDLVVVAEQADDAVDATRVKRLIKETLQQEIGIAIREAKLVPQGWLVKTTSGKISREANRSKYLHEKAAPATVD